MSIDHNSKMYLVVAGVIGGGRPSSSKSNSLASHHALRNQTEASY